MSPRTTRILALAVGVLAALHLVYYLPRVVDDLFISLRYSENLVHGRGCVYNLGERVEGYSSPSWMLLQAFGLALRIEGVLWTKLLGLGSLALLHVGLYRYSRDVFGLKTFAVWIPSFFLSLNSYVTAWSILGLETPLFVALIVWSFVTLRRALDERTTKSRRLAIATLIVLAATRPEGLAWVIVALGATTISDPRLFPELRARVRELLPIAIPVAIGIASLLLLRLAYYRQWVPHTYFAKAESSHFDVANLLGLRTHVRFPETFLTVGGVLLSAVAIRGDRRRVASLAIALMTSFFVCSVEIDWMPNFRHFLPMIVVAPVGLAWIVEVAYERRNPVVLAIAGVSTTLAVIGLLTIARTDMRSLLDPLVGGKHWSEKTKEKLNDAWLSLRNIEPPHVAKMHPYFMGMINQNYRVLEASAAPIADSWYVGRDIGKVGYYTDVRIFETAGLFTPAVVRDPIWKERRAPSELLLDRAFSLHPIAVEWYEWAYWSGRRQSTLTGFHIVNGSSEAPVDLDAKIPGPDPDEILRRYEASAAKFPHAFLLSTLHGESVGGAMARRTRIVRDVVAELNAMGEPPPNGLPSGTLDDDALISRGCVFNPPKVRPGEQTTLRCWFDIAKPTGRPWTVFVHVLHPSGGVLVSGDHPPAGGIQPSWHWRQGAMLRDYVKLTIPSTFTPGAYATSIGLYWGGKRATAAGTSVVANNALMGPTLDVVQ